MEMGLRQDPVSNFVIGRDRFDRRPMLNGDKLLPDFGHCGFCGKESTAWVVNGGPQNEPLKMCDRCVISFLVPGAQAGARALEQAMIASTVKRVLGSDEYQLRNRVDSLEVENDKLKDEVERYLEQIVRAQKQLNEIGDALGWRIGTITEEVKRLRENHDQAIRAESAARKREQASGKVLEELQEITGEEHLSSLKDKVTYLVAQADVLRKIEKSLEAIAAGKPFSVSPTTPVNRPDWAQTYSANSVTYAEKLNDGTLKRWP